MHSFSFMPEPFDSELGNRIGKCIAGLEGYFRYFNGAEASEAKQRTLFHAMRHYDSTSELEPYIKKLARTILKEKIRAYPTDNIAEIYGDAEPSFEIDVEDKLSADSISEVVEVQIVELALIYMGYFITFCEALINKDTRTKYYPEFFKKKCLEFADTEAFVKKCILIYDTWGEDMKRFSSKRGETWGMFDPTYIENKRSRRFKPERIMADPVYGAYGSIDLDSEPWFIRNLTKKVIRVEYRSTLDILEGYLRDTTQGYNPLRFNIGDMYITRSLGGCLSLVNVKVGNVVESTKYEILTNLIKMLDARFLGESYTYFYLLVDSYPEYDLIDKQVEGVPLRFSIERVDTV